MTDRAANDPRHEAKLRAVERAAGAAVFDGCDPAVVRARVEEGIAAAMQLVARRQAATANLSAVRDVPAPVQPASDEAELAAASGQAQPASALDMLSQWAQRRAA